jgi:hypothetical protein
MQFGPEWMRTKPQNSPRSGATQAPPSPPPPLSNSSSLSGAASTARGADEANPFRYSKEDLLRIYKEGGGKGNPIAPDVEKWPEVVRETEAEPISVREITNEERKVSKIPFLLSFFVFSFSVSGACLRSSSDDVLVTIFFFSFASSGWDRQWFFFLCMIVCIALCRFSQFDHSPSSIDRRDVALECEWRTATL